LFSTSNYDRVVTPVRTSVRLSASADPSALHGKVAFTAIVTAATGQADPAGTVRFTVDGKPLGSPVKLCVMRRNLWTRREPQGRRQQPKQGYGRKHQGGHPIVPRARGPYLSLT
jgi:hypothetical protein